MPPKTATMGPPWATRSPTSPSAAITEAIIAPTMFAGMTRNGS